MLTSQRGEASIEFILLIGIMLLIFTFMITVIGIKNNDITNSMIYSDAQNIADTIATEINTASRMEGYYSQFDIPQKIAGIENYSVVIDNNSRLVQVNWGGKNEMSNIATGNVSGSVKPGTNRIRNEGGLVIIES